MELSKINKLRVFHYFPSAASNAVCALITKNKRNQKKEINKLLALEKDKFEEEIQLSEENIKMNTINYLEKIKK
jgi:hypothetical protein